MNFFRKILVGMLTVCLLAGLIPQSISASSVKLNFTAKTSGSGNDIQVGRVEYEGEVTPNYEIYDIPGDIGSLHELEVDFITRIMWKSSARISSVKDNKGKTYKAYLGDRDDDDCDIYISRLKTGRTYTIVINGIKEFGTAKYRKLTLKVKIPAQSASSKKVKVKKVEVDSDDNTIEIDVKFASKVSWKGNAKVSSVKDNKGKSYKGYLIDRDDDDCEIFVDNIKWGRTYTIKISGVKAAGASSYETVTVTAKLPANTNILSVKETDYDVDYEYGHTEWTVSFDFNKKISRSAGSHVIITDSAGNAYSSASSYVEWEDDECEVHLSSGLTEGSTYSYKIVDVKALGSDKYTTLSGTFVAHDD